MNELASARPGARMHRTGGVRSVALHMVNEGCSIRSVDVIDNSVKTYGTRPNVKMVVECRKNGRGGFLENDADGGVNGDKELAATDEYSRRQYNNNLIQSLLKREWRIPCTQKGI